MILCIGVNQLYAQQTFYNVISGTGNGVRFWSSDNYKIHMGNSSLYHYGPVTDYSIKMNMNDNNNRGWTWGKLNFAPIAALSAAGKMQIAGSFTSMSNGLFLGSVGIGTTSPRSILDLNMGHDGDAILIIESDTDNSGSEADNARIEMYQDGRLIGAKIGFNEDVGTPANHFQFDMIQPSGTIDNVFTINPYNGKIGLGLLANSEDARLVVDGKILAEEVKVQTVPASDYVFEPDYALKPLQEVDLFIQQNKHLPDIPSAEEFAKNGVGLGEMDDMLLRKVEELTLYMINQENRMVELEKKNEQQAQEIQELKNKLSKQ
jgi:hypothetical protein